MFTFLCLYNTWFTALLCCFSLKAYLEVQEIRPREIKFPSERLGYLKNIYFEESCLPEIVSCSLISKYNLYKERIF